MSPQVSSSIQQELPETYGSFFLGKWEVAVPTRNIRQVVEMPETMAAVPRAAPFLLGTFDLRGTIVAVVELSKLLGIPHIDDSRKIVAVIEYRGRSLGVILERTGDVFRGDTGQNNELEPETKSEFVKNIFRLEDGKRLVHNFELDSLYAIPNVPRDNGGCSAIGREPTRTGTSTQCLTFRVADSHCALPMTDVQEIFKVGTLRKDFVSLGPYLGVMEVRGGEIPIVDLSTLLRSRNSSNHSKKAINHGTVVVMQHTLGCVGLLVDSVDSIVSYTSDQLVHFPDANLCKSQLFVGCLANNEVNDIIVLDPLALLANSEIEKIVTAHQEKSGSPDGENGKRQADNDNNLNETFLVFTAGERFAVRINEVQEIIEHPEKLLNAPGLDHCFAGVHNLREQEVVLVVDFRAARSYPPNPPNPSAHKERKVLIFAAEGGKAGFVVDSVDSIVTVRENSELEISSCISDDTSDPTAISSTLFLPDESGDKTFVPLIELKTQFEVATNASAIEEPALV